MTKVIVNLNELSGDNVEIIQAWECAESVLDTVEPKDAVPFDGQHGEYMIVFDFNDEQALHLRVIADKLGIEDALVMTRRIQDVCEDVIKHEMYALKRG